MQFDGRFAVTGLVVTDNADGAVGMISPVIMMMQRGNSKR
jgi:hypothetical protein